MHLERVGVFSRLAVVCTLFDFILVMKVLSPGLWEHLHNLKIYKLEKYVDIIVCPGDFFNNQSLYKYSHLVSLPRQKLQYTDQTFGVLRS